MKTKLLIPILAVVALIFGSCSDGLPGNSYLQFTDPGGHVSSLTIYDSNIPNGFFLNTFYLDKAGTYEITYYYDLVTYYNETYTIVQTPGETWNGVGEGFLTSAPDGVTRHYTFDCDASAGSELTFTNGKLSHPDIIIDKTIYFKGGKMIIKGTGVYDPNHTHLSNQNSLNGKHILNASIK